MSNEPETEPNQTGERKRHRGERLAHLLQPPWLAYVRPAWRIATSVLSLMVATILIGIIIINFSIQKQFSGDVWWSVAWIFIFGCCSGAAGAVLVRQGWREVLSPLNRALRERSFYVALAVSFVTIIVAVLWGHRYHKAVESANVNGFMDAVNNEQKGIFAVVTGFATVFALVLTVHSLWEIKRTITSFPDLIDRLCLMLKKASALRKPVPSTPYTCSATRRHWVTSR